VKQLVDGLGGMVWVEAGDHGAGYHAEDTTVFNVVLPLRPQNSQRAPAELIEQPA
jgi:hypothetical protein